MFSSQWKGALATAGLGESRIELGFCAGSYEQRRRQKPFSLLCVIDLQIFKYCPVGRSGTIRTKLLLRIQKFEEVDLESRNKERLGKKRGEEAKRGF